MKHLFVFIILMSVSYGEVILISQAQLDPDSETVNFVNEFQSGGVLQSLDNIVIVTVVGDNNIVDLLIAEKFTGQTLVENGNFDLLDNIANDPLSLDPGNNGENLFFAINRFGGAGRQGFDQANGRGEGSVAFLFPTPVSELGITIQDIGQSNVPGNVIARFFDENGNNIDTVSLDDLQAGFLDANLVAFREENNLEIIAGVSFENIDEAGITLENLIFQADASSSGNSVPEPEIYAMLLLLFLVFAVRKFSYIRGFHSEAEGESV